MDNPHPAISAAQGLTWHRTQYYSFFLPVNWYAFAWTDDREGQIYGPCWEDPATVFAVSIRHLDFAIDSGDLDILSSGFFETLKELPACNIQPRCQQVAGKFLQLDAKYTFDERGITRKCWQHVVYHETRQIVFTAQGATLERYDFWFPSFLEAMMSMCVHTHH